MSESGNAGANSANSRQTSGSDRRTYWAAAVSVVAPPVMFIATGIGLLLVTNSLDPANTLGISDNLLNGFLIGLVGLLAGIVVGLVARMRGADLVLPPLVGLFVGVATYLAFVAFEAGEYVELYLDRLVILWIGLSVSLFLATRLTGYALAAGAVAAILVGVGIVVAVEALPEPPVEVFLVLNEYTVDETTGECSGSGALAGVVEGSRVSLIDSSGPIIDPSATPLESRVLPSGTEITRDADPAFLFAATNQDADCLFIWADPGLELSVYVEDVFLFTESGFDGEWGTHGSGQRVVFTLGSGGEVPGGGEPEDGPSEG